MDCKLLLKKYSIKVTKGRLLVLEIVTNSENAISADNIYELCKLNKVNVDLSTIYRTLELFCDKEIVEKFDLGNGKYNYIIKDISHKHMLQCSYCHKEIEIDCPMLQIEELIKNKTGYTLLEHDLKLKAICKQCKDKEKNNK